jgi:LysR family hydrogen peroxide-inducible transcriptional activator
MEMHQVRYFLALAGTRNFTRAAEQCHVTQPSLTRAIKMLEEELGGPLLHRDRHNTDLTDLGRVMLPQLERMWASVESVKTTAASLLSLKDAPLKLGLMCTVGPLRFAGFLCGFRSQQPGVTLSLIERKPSDLAAALHGGDLDVAVMAQATAFDDRFRVEPLYRERFAVGFAPGHRFQRMTAVPMAAMDGESYLIRVNCEYFDQLKEAREASGATLRYAYKSEREDWIQAMAAAGLGICFLPVYSPVVAGLLTRPIIEPEVSREVSLVTVAGRRHAPALATFVRAIKSYAWPEREDSSHPPTPQDVR